MLDYTQVAGKKIYNDVRKISLVCNVFIQIFYIFYLIYAILSSVGVFYVNLVMLVLSSAYFAFFLYNHLYGKNTALSKAIRESFKWCKRLVKLFNLGIMIYSIVVTAVEPDPLSIILTVLMALLWVADILLEITVIIVKGWCLLLYESLKADVEVFTRPVASVGNFFKRMSGKEVEEPAPPSKRRLYLDELVDEFRTEKQNKKLEKKYLKQRKKEEAKERKRAKKAQRKQHEFSPSLDENQTDGE